MYFENFSASLCRYAGGNVLALTSENAAPEFFRRRTSVCFSAISLLLLLALSAFLSASKSFAEADKLSPRIILYHRVGDDRYPSTNVSLQAFTSQMTWLKDNGYTVVSTKQIEGFLKKGASLPDKAVAIHFDDGYKSVYDNAYPVLRKFGYPFTVFVPTGALDGSYKGYISWDAATIMARNGADFGFHGAAHERLGTPRKGESGDAFAKRLKDLFSRKRKAMREKGFEAAWIAYPYGEYSDFTIAAAEEVFDLGFSQDPGAVGPGAGLYAIPRFAVVGSLGDMAYFKERMGYSALNFKDSTPACGAILSAPPAIFSAVVLNPGRYEPASVNMFVSELGRIDASFDENGTVKAVNASKLKRRLNRVIISVRERNATRYALGSWLIIKPDGI